MKIFLLGYMGSGKSYIGKRLAQHLDYVFIDLDEHIEKKHGTSISQLFEKKGEIFFRKEERNSLEEVIKAPGNMVISLGGGTPCYGDNLDVIQKAAIATSIYLKCNIQTLTSRLFDEKDRRPMISHLETREELEEFIRKHLFERGFYYNQSEHIIDCNSKSPKDIVDEISGLLG